MESFIFLNIKSLLGTNHCSPLSYMAKSYIWLGETNECINEFQIGNIMNPNLSISKAFKEQVTKCMETTFYAMTQQHIIKIL